MLNCFPERSWPILLRGNDLCTGYPSGVAECWHEYGREAQSVAVRAFDARDIYAAIATLRALGLAEANESAAAVERLLAPSDGGGGFDVFWGHEWGEHAAFFDARLRPHMMVSSVMGLMAETLGDKDFLGFALQHCAAQYGGAECAFIPPIYSLPAQKTQWQRAHRAHAYWIRKDKAVWGSQGVSIVSSTKALPQESSFLLQLYVSRPLLWNGHKHDLRLWALITCAAPLRVYLHGDGFALFASDVYDAGSLERYSFITNAFVNRKRTGAEDGAGAGGDDSRVAAELAAAPIASRALPAAHGPAEWLCARCALRLVEAGDQRDEARPRSGERREADQAQHRESAHHHADAGAGGGGAEGVGELLDEVFHVRFRRGEWSITRSCA